MSNFVPLAGVALSIAVSASANAEVLRYQLSDHPDGNASPPPYGLRYDSIFGGVGGSGGQTSFSFSAAAADDSRENVVMTIDTEAGTISIEGEVFGGEDAGSDYGFGAGWYDLSFTYSANVMASGDGWIVEPGDPSMNFGSLISQGNADVMAGEAFNIFDRSGGVGFEFFADGHRLDGDDSTHVGRGWVTSNSDGSDGPGTQDWLFIATPIDVPAPASAALLGLGGLVAARRRR